MLKPALRESQIITGPVLPAMVLTYALNTAIILHYVNQHPDYRFMVTGYAWWVEVLLFTGAIITALLLKLLTIIIIEFIIGQEWGQRQYRREIIKNYAVQGLLLTPLTIAACINNIDNQKLIFNLFLLLCIMFYGYRLFRGVLAGIHAGAYPLYIFYYLCALELVPLIYLITVLIR